VGAGTPITKNGANPNYVFRVSAVDEIVNRAMLQYAQKTFNAKNCGMILVNNPWGESNEKGLMAALGAKGLKPAASRNSRLNDVDVVPHLTRLKAAGSDCLFLVGNVGPVGAGREVARPDGLEAADRLALGTRGRRFTELAGPSAKEVHFIQTYSFFGKQSPVGEKVLKALMAKYPDIKGPGRRDARGRRRECLRCDDADRARDRERRLDLGTAIREGYYKIAQYQGLIKSYAKPFTPENHDAVNENDYVWTHFIDNQILPVDMKK
jgi:branched-chain amino acid transport system substrate-binding protein